MTSRTQRNWIAATGIATVATTVVAIVLLTASGPPASGDSSQQVATFFLDHHHAVMAALWLASVSLGFNLAFYVLLGDTLRRKSEADAGLVNLGVLGGAVFIAIIFMGFAVLAQAAYRSGSGDPATQRTLYDVYELSLTMTGVPTAVSLVALSVVLLRTRIFPAWLGWYGGVVAAVHLLSSGSMATSGLFTPANIGGTIAPVAFEIWVLAVSILLLVRTPEEAPAAAGESTGLTAAAS